jgi:hypothetical protein
MRREIADSHGSADAAKRSYATASEPLRTATQQRRKRCSFVRTVRLGLPGWTKPAYRLCSASPRSIAVIVTSMSASAMHQFRMFVPVNALPDAAGLLDSYQRERRPVAEQILDWSRAQVALMRPSRSAQALRAIVRDLIATRDGATYFAERVWGVSLRYDLGGDHPLVGRSAPDFQLADGTRLNEHFRDGGALLVDFGGSDRLRMLAERCGQHVTYLACDASDRRDLHALLVRADGFVAWASDRPTDGAEAAGALSQLLDTIYDHPSRGAFRR